MKLFYITGFPRSRTGWLANLFCHGPSLCLHDGLFTNEFDKLRGKVNVEYFGNSDSGILLTPSPFEYGPDEKMVLVERPREDCEKSYLRYFSEHPYPDFGQPDANDFHRLMDMREKRMKLIKDTSAGRVLSVKFSDLDSVDCVESIWNHVIKDVAFDRIRFGILNKLAVNPASQKVRVLWV